MCEFRNPRRTMMISNHILQNLNELRHRDKLCDLQLLSEDGEAFNLHKCVFIAACKRQFDIACSRENEMHTAKMYRMILPQVSSVELKAMISFIYGENTKGTTNSELLSALSKLHMLDLLESSDQSTASVRIKEEPGSPDVSVIVEVQVANDPEQLSPSREHASSKQAALQSTISNIDPDHDDLDENNSDMELITLKQDREYTVSEPAVLQGAVSTDPDVWDENNSNIELKTLKQECEELANNDPTVIEVKTEEDQHIEKLMDQFSNELDLLKTPNQTPDMPNITKEINVGKNNDVEKVKTNLFPRTDNTVGSVSTTDTVPPTDLVTNTFASHTTILPKDVSPVKALTDTASIQFSLEKEAKSRVIPSSKYKMILPRVSYPANFPSISSLLSQTNFNHKASRDTKTLNEISANSQAAVTSKPKMSSGEKQANIQHKTIATILALPPLMPSTFMNEKKIENSKANNDEVQEDKNKETIDSSMAEKQISGLSAEVSMESCGCDMSEGDIKDKNLKDAQIVIETMQKDVENSVSLIDHSKLDHQYHKKNSFRRHVKLQRFPSGYKRRTTMPKKLCKHIRKKNLDFGVVQNSENTPPPSKLKSYETIDNINNGLLSSAVVLQRNQPIQDTANSSSSVAHSGSDSSNQDSLMKTISTAASAPEVPTSLSLSEQVHAARDRKRRRKALHPLKRADKRDCYDGNFEVEGSEELTESINTLMRSAAEIIGPDSDCKDNADKIVADLSMTDIVKLPNEEVVSSQNTILPAGNSNTSVPTRLKDFNAERNAVTQFSNNDRLGSVIAKASPLLVKLLSAIRKTEKVPLGKCLVKDVHKTSFAVNEKSAKTEVTESLIHSKTLIEKLDVETISNTASASKEQAPVSKSMKNQTTKIAPASKEQVPVAKSMKDQTTETVSASKEQAPVSKSMKDQTTKTPPASKEQAPVSKYMKDQKTRTAPASREQAPVSKSMKNQNTVKSASTHSPEIAKLLARKVENFGPQNNDTPTCYFINKERQGVFEIFKQPLPNLTFDNTGNGQNNNENNDNTVAKVGHTEHMPTQFKELIPVKAVQSSSVSDLKEKNNSKRPRKGRPKKCHLSVQQLLHIQPKLPQMILNSSDVSKESKGSSGNEGKSSRKRHLSMPEVSDLKCMKKCRSVISMKKQKPRVKKRNSLDPVGGGDELPLSLQRSVPSKKDQDDVHFIQSVSQSSSAEIVYSNDKIKSIMSQPARIAPKTTDKLKPVSKPTVIVMGPGSIKPVVNGILNCYEKPLSFTAEQMIPCNFVSQNIKSAPSLLETHKTDTEVYKSDREVHKTDKEKGLPLDTVILKTFQSYRPIAPKRPDET